jgi:hypothetical protein
MVPFSGFLHFFIALKEYVITLFPLENFRYPLVVEVAQAKSNVSS